MMQTLPDLRSTLSAAHAWVLELLAGVRPDQLDLPTPCPEFTVTDLVAHLYMVVGRVRVLGEGGDISTEHFSVAELPEDVVAGYRERVRAAGAAWSDDASLTRIVSVPWGEVPGAMAVGGYLIETLTHGWDLALATGQPGEVAPEVAELALAIAQQAIPAEPRGGEVPFGPVVASTEDTGPTLRFVHWMGRG